MNLPRLYGRERARRRRLLLRDGGRLSPYFLFWWPTSVSGRTSDSRGSLHSLQGCQRPEDCLFCPVFLSYPLIWHGGWIDTSVILRAVLCVWWGRRYPRWPRRLAGLSTPRARGRLGNFSLVWRERQRKITPKGFWIGAAKAAGRTWGTNVSKYNITYSVIQRASYQPFNLFSSWKK